MGGRWGISTAICSECSLSRLIYRRTPCTNTHEHTQKVYVVDPEIRMRVCSIEIGTVSLRRSLLWILYETEPQTVLTRNSGMLKTCVHFPANSRLIYLDSNFPSTLSLPSLFFFLGNEWHPFHPNSFKNPPFSSAGQV